MADKEHEGVEKGMDTSNAEAPESGAKTNETGSGEGEAGDKPEQQISDDKKTESEDHPSGVEGGGSRDDEKPEEGSNWFQGFLSIVQALASIATIAVAIFTFCTLKEMQTERDNAYRPEIVIMRNVFEGGQVGSNESEINGECVYFDPNASAPYWIVTSIEALSKDGILYCESPYLSLKNIGQGTAKDVRVTFHINDWLKRAVDRLNGADIGIFTLTEYDPSATQNTVRSEVLYRESAEDMEYVFISSYEMFEKDEADISYISSDEDAVNVALPDSWCKMLAILYYKCYQQLTLMHVEGIPLDTTLHSGLPDLNITIEYADMQGKRYKQEETISWEAKCKFSNSTAPSGDEDHSIYLWTGFFDDYIR